MRPQDIAGQARSRVLVEALTPHTRAFAHAACAFSGNSVMVPIGCTQVTHTSEPGQLGRFTLQSPVISNRRHIICLTASKASWPSVWSHSLQLAPSRQKKSSWSSSPSPSAKSRFTPVSTSNPLAVYKGQALRPVPTHRADPEPIGRTQGATARKPEPILPVVFASKRAGSDYGFSKSRSAGTTAAARASGNAWGCGEWCCGARAGVVC